MMLAKGSCAGEKKHMEVFAYFKDATLLVEKSRVQISGLNVGYITSRELNVRPPRPDLIAAKRFAKISVVLNRPVTLYTNTIIYKRAASLLGDFYLEIDPGTYEWVDDKGKRHVGETIKDGDELLFVVEATTTSGVIRQVSDLMPTVKALLQDVRKFTKGPLHSIGKNIDDGITENRKSRRTGSPSTLSCAIWR
ncbi:MAG: MCE family protein [Deltaproteobacteria bacterium]|nr:MCE family protein [Deltaproteobacteria bacterium]